MEVTPAQLQAISPRLVPVIAHDRAGFGGGLFSTGVILLFMGRHSRITKSLVQVVWLMGVAGFGAAIGVHPAIGYTDFGHLAPAYAGALIFFGTAIRLGQEYRATRRRVARQTAG